MYAKPKMGMFYGTDPEITKKLNFSGMSSSVDTFLWNINFFPRDFRFDSIVKKNIITNTSTILGYFWLRLPFLYNSVEPSI